MFLNYFILNQNAAVAGGQEVFLFRQTSAELTENKKGSVLESIFRYDRAFSLHLILGQGDGLPGHLNNLLERVFLIIGRVNYQTTLGRKILFVSYANAESTMAVNFISKLKSLLASKIYITQIPYGFSGDFTSSLNVSIEKTVTGMDEHFRNFILRMISQKTLIDNRYFYCIISEEAVDHGRLNDVLTEQLRNVADLISVLGEASDQIGLLTEELQHTQIEKKSFLNAIAFLKRELQHLHSGGEESRKTSQQAELAALLLRTQHIENLKEKYNKEYERLPFLYKKIGVILKIVFGKVEFGYYLNPRQKRDFMDILHSLPEEKQIEIWYYYEYEILPGWYKRLGKRLKNVNK